MALSSSSIVSQAKHDVFLSFRGEDTRCTFTSHLYDALCRRKIDTFLDDELIKKGDTLSPTLIAAIEGSKISVIIFSENYASSTWCLDELDKIIECKNAKGRIVIPVFYHIDPSNVRKQSGSYEDAFIKHEKHNQSKVQKWRMALSEASNIAGWDWRNTRFESKFVENIADDVLQKLNRIIDPQDLSEYVGIHKRIEHIESLLRVGSTSVHIIGIWGMGGIGKTTLAEVLFERLSSQFEGHCIIRKVTEEWTKCGEHELQNRLFTQIFEDKKFDISTHSISSTFVRKRLSRTKILIVLDDVSHSQQIEHLIGGKDRFGPGSKIIITTRNKDVLRNENDGIYEVVPLDIEEASKLFSLKAFRQDHPKCGFEHLLECAVRYAKGVPLFLKVLGSHLCSKSPRDWGSTFQKLIKISNAEIHPVLRLSYEELDFEEQKIFLHIACFWKGETKCRIVSLLDGCGYSTDIGLRGLEDKSLITMNHVVEMHDLIQEMGQQIVRQESIEEPDKRSRLWNPDEIYHVLKCKKGENHSTESMLLDMSKIEDVEISPNALTVMPNLKFLKFFLPNYDRRSKVRISKGLDDLPEKLRYFRWDRFPLKALPPSFCAEMLVELDLKDSLSEKLWDGEQDLSNLKSLSLSGCKHLIELPNLSKAKNLKEIHLDYCVRLRDIPSSILSLNRLLALNLSGCIELRCIRSDVQSRCLRWLNLSGCSKLAEYSVTSEKLEYLSLDGTALENLPKDFYKIGLDTWVKISSRPHLKRLPPIFYTSSSITSLCLDGCSNLSELPDNLDLLSALSELSVRGTSIKKLPKSIKLLSKLRTLNVSLCKRLLSLTTLPRLLQDLNASGCISLGTVSSSGVTELKQNSFGIPNGKLLRRQIQEGKIPLRHHYSQRFEFYSCRSLDSEALQTIMGEAVERMKYAAHISSMLRASAESDPYHQFRQFSKDTDAQSFEYNCRRLCTSPERHKFPSWFWVQRVESSTVTVKLNGNCCSYCRSHPYAFGIYLSNKGENTDLGFDGRHRICMEQWDQNPIWSYWKLGCNDVRLSLPWSSVTWWFRYQSTKTTCVTVNLSPDFHLSGFILFVVVTDCLSNANCCLQNVKCKCYLENEGKRSQSYQSAYCCDSEMDLISDTLFAWYDAYVSDKMLEAIEESRANDQCTTYNTKLSFEFSITQEGLNYQIKKCGVSPIYASDLEFEDSIGSVKCGEELREKLMGLIRRRMDSRCSFPLVLPRVRSAAQTNVWMPTLTVTTVPLHQTKKLKK